MNRFQTILLALAVAALTLMPAAADPISVGTLELDGLWTRATPPRAPAGGGFLTITNTGDEPDRLVAVSSPQVEKGEIHEMKVEDGVMTMRPLDDGLEIPAHGTVTLASGGLHLMFIGLRAPLVEGEDLPVTLTFEKAGTVDAVLPIAAIGSKGAGGDGGQGEMKMDMKQ